MRKITFFLAFVFCLSVSAQESTDTMYIYKKGNIVERIPVYTIDSITFVPQTKTDVTVYKAVDLGLPSGVKWASCNVGATKPEEYGGYYAWGELESKNDYTSTTAVNYQKNIGDDISATSYDIARVKWGAPWRMPTKAEQEELCRECSWEKSSLNGVNGYVVTGPNGNTIFLPAAGYKYGTEIYYEGVNGYYWSSVVYCILNSYFLYYDAGYYGLYYYARFDGLTVRPVCE